MENKVFNFGGKTFAVALAAAVAGMVMVACSGDDDEEEPAIEKHNVVIEIFAPGMVGVSEEQFEALKKIDDIKARAAAPDVDSLIVMPVVSKNWAFCDALDVRIYKDDYIKPIFDAVPNAYGKGDFNFKPGEASKLPNDSIWYVNHGFTINANLKK